MSAWDRVEETVGQLVLPLPPRRVRLTPASLPVRIGATPYFLRMVNSSGFTGDADVEVKVHRVSDPPTFIIDVAVTLTTYAATRAGITHSLWLRDPPRPGTVAHAFHIFQEAVRRKSKGGEGLGPADFRFDVFVPQSI